MAVETQVGGSGWRTVAARRLRLSSLLTTLLFSSRFLTIWIATALLLVVCEIIAPATLNHISLSTMLPFGTVLAVAAIGQMLVVMTGGIDLSMAAAISLLANVLVGTASGSDGRLGVAILVVLGCAAVMGLANGLLVGVLGLNSLITTLASGLVFLGINAGYREGIPNESVVPPVLSDWVLRRYLGVSPVFWLGLLLTIVVALLLRSTTVGRRFQTVGANPRAAWIAGVHVRSHVVFAYVAATMSAGVAAILLVGILKSPSSDPGASLFLAPIAAVVLAGASLTGGLASVLSTWVAAFALTILNTMLRVLGLTHAVQFVVFGVAIVIGMVFSGDRIAAVLGRLLQHPGVRAIVDTDESVDRREEGLEHRESVA